MDGSTVTALASIVVAGIAASSAYASQRSAARATTVNTDKTTRSDMEKEAYERARAFDTETIRRQDTEIGELRQENEDLRSEMDLLRAENRGLRGEMRGLTQRLSRLEEVTNSIEGES